MMLKGLCAAVLLVLTAYAVNQGRAGSSPEHAGSKRSNDVVSFKNDVFPIIKEHCLPCHAEDNYNPSELSLDSYKDLISGGKHGNPVVAGKAKGSVLVQKLGEKPPFGDRMPLNSKKKIEEGKAKWLSKDEIEVKVNWVNQGAKDN
jgi:hypothetical protein